MYRTILQAQGSHIAAKAPGTYAVPSADPLAISGTGTLYAPPIIYLAPADYPTGGSGNAAELRVRAQIYTNDTAPGGTFTAGLHPVTRPTTSGGAGLCIYTLGAAVAGSTASVATPAADGLHVLASANFALPATGHYCLGIVTTATVAASAHCHINAALQVHNA